VIFVFLPPFTVLPALMNEYRVPELNVQNGVLNALSFLFEHLGDGKGRCHFWRPFDDSIMMSDEAMIYVTY
jgi:splicing factor 3B subunit 1